MPKPVINKKKCNLCIDQESVVCLDSCPVAVFEKDKNLVIVKNPDNCIGCRACEAQCPREAVIVKDEE